MGPNDAELVRVYTREIGGTIADVTFPFDKDIEVVVEAEAGTALFDSGGQFDLRVFVRNLKANGGKNDPILVPLKGKSGNADVVQTSGAFGSGWDAQATNFIFIIPKSSLGPKKEGAIMEILACLQIGIKRPDVSIARSPLFIIHKP
ncbi:hypothetical protein GWO43_09895 [candidate division KSB1 bacterium]|nr:hypothetical protein [candidate division KSB1 bacterium]NIR69510.1 hypothetical protein [candidate division KSB1 bacterium]NIS24278.1 hypothetical protein [candidate division KSB1 bacterium]NIT71193.1 hypothetical protein [candidate division KSB1 bacterium]NIU24897.1 hypothetical protein [candidate division KSB1 bacterium]